MIVSNEDRPYQGKQYTVAIVTTTERAEAVRRETEDLIEATINVSPSFVTPWAVHEFEHSDIDRRVTHVFDDMIRVIADGITRYVEPTTYLTSLRTCRTLIHTIATIN